MDPLAKHSDSLEIIEAGPQHADLVTPLFDAYRQFYRQPADLAGARDFISHRLTHKESVIFLALVRQGNDQAPAGFTQLYPSFSSIALQRVWILYDLFVVPDARRQGIGRALLERARAFAARTQACELTLQTAADNVAAQRLYESLGWKRDEEFLTYSLPL